MSRKSAIVISLLIVIAAATYGVFQVPGFFVNVSSAASPGWDNINIIYYNPTQDDAAKYLAQAATELKTNLEQVAGKTFTIDTTTSPATGIYLDVNPKHPELAARNEEAFKLLSDASGLHITGKTPLAVRHGAYTLLE